MRVPVDTTLAVDRLKKAKKGFKFERFDVFFKLIRWSWGRQGPKRTVGREAVRMGGLLGDSPSADRSLQSRRKTPQIASSPASSARDSPSVVGLRGAEPFGMATLLRRSPVGSQVLSWPVIRNPQFRGMIGSYLPRPELNDSGVPFSIVPFQRNRYNPSLVWPKTTPPSAAQPLQYGLGEGWNDCSSAQEPAGRGNEETAK